MWVRARFRDLLAEFSRDRIVVLSTHVVSDAGSVATSPTVVAGRFPRHGSSQPLLGEATR